MKKKSLRMVCLLLAGLMLLTTFGMLFSQLAMADETSSGGTGGGSSSGSLSMIEIKFTDDKGKPQTKLVKGDVYTAEVTIIDPSVANSDFVADKAGINQYNATLPEGSSPFDENYSQNLKADILQAGGNFKILSGTKTVQYTAGEKDRSAKFLLTFDVQPDGKGDSLCFTFGYEYLHRSTTDAVPPVTTISKKNTSSLLNETIIGAPMPYVYIGGGGDDDSSSSSEDDDDSYRTPKPNIIITEYNYGGTDIMSGSDFSLSVKFQNTSKDLELENIIMQITPSTDLSIRNGSNSTFIEKLGVGKTHTQTLQMTSRNATVPEPQQITVKFTYEYVLDKQRKDGERTEVLAVPVVQLDRFSVGELSVPEQLWSNESASLSIDYVNKGKTEVANVSARLESDIPGISESQTVGNIKAGDSGTVDFTFTAPASGSVSGKVVVTYENAKGQEITTERPFSTMVMDMGGGPNEDMGVDMPMPEPEDTGLSTPAKVMAVVGGLMVAALTGTVVVKKVKMKREEETDEDI